MKMTGVIRRMDDLGRIVIPKEIRKTMRIQPGDNLGFFIDGDNIILKKYSPIESMEMLAQSYADTFNSVLKHNVIITDKDKVIAISGDLKKKYANKDISEFISRSIERRDSFVERQKKGLEIVPGVLEDCYYAFSSIYNSNDTLGGVLIVDSSVPIMDYEEKVASVLSNLLSSSFVE